MVWNRKRKILLILSLIIPISIKLLVNYLEERQRHLDETIIKVAKAGDFDKVLSLIESGANPNGYAVDNNTPIHYAVGAKRLDIVKALIKKGVDLKQGGLEAVLLRTSIYNEDEEIFDYLISQGADLNKSTYLRQQNSALELIVDLHSRGYSNKEILMSMAKKALKKKADPNKRCSFGITPFTKTVINGDYEMAVLLLEYGADPTIRSDESLNSMDYAGKYTRKNFIELLVKHGMEMTLKEAVAIGDVEKAKAFLQEDPSLLKINYYETNSLLGLALKYGQEEIADFIMKHKPDLFHLNSSQQSLLHLAASGGAPKYIQILIDAGIDVNLRDGSKETPLHDTAWSDRSKCAEVLIKNGADINAKGPSEITPLLWSASYDSPGVMKALLKAGADPNLVGSYDGSLPLDSACRYSSKNEVPETVKILLESGANVNGIGDNGQTALHYAVSSDNTELIKYLLEKGADPLILNDKGLTALSLAQKSEDKEIGKLFERYLKK